MQTPEKLGPQGLGGTKSPTGATLSLLADPPIQTSCNMDIYIVVVAAAMILTYHDRLRL